MPHSSEALHRVFNHKQPPTQAIITISDISKDKQSHNIDKEKKQAVAQRAQVPRQLISKERVRLAELQYAVDIGIKPTAENHNPYPHH
jgi:hypothetical protein